MVSRQGFSALEADLELALLDQVGFKLRDPPDFASLVLGLKVRTTTRPQIEKLKSLNIGCDKRRTQLKS